MSSKYGTDNSRECDLREEMGGGKGATQEEKRKASKVLESGKPFQVLVPQQPPFIS